MTNQEILKNKNYALLLLFSGKILIEREQQIVLKNLLIEANSLMDLARQDEREKIKEDQEKLIRDYNTQLAHADLTIQKLYDKVISLQETSSTK